MLRCLASRCALHRQPTEYSDAVHGLLGTAWLASVPLCRSCSRQASTSFETTVEASASSSGTRAVPKAELVRQRLRTVPQCLAIPDAGGSDELSAVAGGNSSFRRLLWLLGYNSNEAVTIRGATGLYDAVCAQADGSALHAAADMDASFYSRWCLITLHVWLLHQRLAADGNSTKALRQEVHVLFQEDVEVRIRQEISIRVKSSVQELEKAFYGTALALDDALRNKRELWQPLHRNFYNAQDARVGGAQLLAAYTQREAECLAMTPTESLLRGKIRFTALS